MTREQLFKELAKLHKQLGKVKLKKSMREAVIDQRKTERSAIGSAKSYVGTGSSMLFLRCVLWPIDLLHELPANTRMQCLTPIY